MVEVHITLFCFFCTNSNGLNRDADESTKRFFYISSCYFANPQGEDVEARGRGLVGVAVRGQAHQRPCQRCSHQGCPPIDSYPIISIHWMKCFH